MNLGIVHDLGFKCDMQEGAIKSAALYIAGHSGRLVQKL
jgi:hypothetical protein